MSTSPDVFDATATVATRLCSGIRRESGAPGRKTRGSILLGSLGKLPVQCATEDAFLLPYGRGFVVAADAFVAPVRAIFSFFMRERSVLGLRPSLSGALPAPLIFPPDSSRASLVNSCPATTTLDLLSAFALPSSGAHGADFFGVYGPVAVGIDSIVDLLHTLGRLGFF